jgi:hypothetical protein
MIQPFQIRRAAELRREVAEREAALYGRHLADVIFLRQRGFGIHSETTSAGRRFRLGNRLVSGTELRAVAARERRLLKHARKGK